MPPADYIYRSEDRSVLKPMYDKFFVRPLVNRLSDRVAPNDVSLASQFCAILPVIASLLIGVYSPQWLWLAIVPIGYLGYLVLDYADGTHARKTGASSPLGELVDHWCDAWNSVLLPAAWGIAMGASPVVVCVLGALTGLAYVQAMVDHRETGTLRMDALGAGEAMTAMMLTMVVAGIVGRETLCGVQLTNDVRLVDVLHVICAVGSGSTAVTMVVRRGLRSLDGSIWFIGAAALAIVWVAFGLHPVIGMFLLAAMCTTHAGRNVLARTTGLVPRGDAVSIIALSVGFVVARVSGVSALDNILGVVAATVAVLRAVLDFVWGLRALRVWLRQRELLGVLAPSLVVRVG